MKKIISFIILILIMLLCLTGCSENKKQNTNISTTASNQKKSNQNTNTDSSSNSAKSELETFDFSKVAEDQIKYPEIGDQIAIMHIKDYGSVYIRFFPEVAPKAVENFITHSKEGYYNGLTFHRVMNDFMIQGGDPSGNGTGGESIWGTPFEDEFSYSLVPYRGALCMANSGSNTNGSQFFIEQANFDENTYNTLKQYGYPTNLLEAYKKYDGSMHLFGVHTVFGQVFQGMDVVDEIAKTETNSKNKPINDVVIESIEITDYSE